MIASHLAFFLSFCVEVRKKIKIGKEDSGGICFEGTNDCPSISRRLPIASLLLAMLCA